MKAPSEHPGSSSFRREISGTAEGSKGSWRSLFPLFPVTVLSGSHHSRRTEAVSARQLLRFFEAGSGQLVAPASAKWAEGFRAL
jgi:hypothetical protein